MELWSEEAGEGPPVLLVHAGICDARMWDPQWETFPARHRTIRCDLRGFGRTPLPPEPFSHGADIVELIEGLGGGPVALVGASFGALMCLDVAIARPDLLTALVLAGSPLAGHEWSAPVRELFAAEEDALEDDDLDLAVELNLQTWVDGPERGPDAVPAGLRQRVGEMQTLAFELQLPVWEHAADELLTEDLAERWREVSAPTLVLHGAADVPDIAQIAERLANGIEGAHGETIDGAAHLPSLERPAEFDRVVLDFLAG